MSEVSKQQLSALLDGELPTDEARFLLRRIQAEPALAELWSRYQLMGDCLRQRVCMPVRVSLSVRVMQQIAQEQIAQEQTPARSHRNSRWVRYGIGGGIAASVAVVALVWMQPRQIVPTTSVATERVAVSSTPALADNRTEAMISRSTAPQTPDLSSLLRRPGSSLLNVQPAAAVRSQGSVLMSQTGELRPVWMRVPATAGQHHPETFYLQARSADVARGVAPAQSHAQAVPR